MFSDDEKQFIVFWAFIFASAIGFWTVAVHWVWQRIVS